MTSYVADLLVSLRGPLTALAECWLDNGAAAFGVWVEGRPLLRWPADSPSLERPDLVAPITSSGRVVGEYRLAGKLGAAAARRLAAEADWTARVIQQEGDLQSMTAALIDCQDQLLAMYDLTASTRSHVGVSETLAALVREAAHLVQTEGAFAVLAQPGQPALIEHHPRPMLAQETVLGLFQQTQAAGGELLLNAGDAAAVLGPASDIRNLLVEPIRIRETVTASLGLLNKLGDDFSSPDIKLARAIAQQVGAQIETVLLYRETLERAKLQHEMDLAARVQLALLPRRLPRVAGLDLYAHSRPAMQVGGDFYDLVAQPNRPFLFSVGDVSGKGIAAAFFMSMLRTLIRSVAKSVSAMTPELVLARSAQDMYDDFNDVGMFATVFVGQYEPAQRRLTYANAGHSPVIYCPAGRPAQLLPADDVPVGILPLDQPQSRSLTLQPGDALVVASDGFSEARDLNGVMFGYDRLLQHVQAQIHAGKTARETTLALFERLSDYGAGCPQDDDQTLVVLKGVPA